MIGNIIKGRSFQGVVTYAATKDKARLIGGNMAGKTPKTLITEFEIVQQNLRRNLGKAVFHVSLSLTLDEHLSDDSWSKLAIDYLNGMNFTQNQYVVYQHLNTLHEHIHLIANRVSFDGSTVNDSFDFLRSDNIIRNLEKEYGLVPTRSSTEVLRKNQSNGEYRQLERTGEESIRKKLQEKIDSSTNNNQTMPELIDRLLQVGVKAKVSLTKGGGIRGISYEVNGTAFSGTKLGSAYTWTGLQKHKGVEYDSSMFEAIMEPSVNLQKHEEIEDAPSTLKTVTEIPVNAVIQTNQRILSEKVFTRAKKVYNQLGLEGYVKKNKQGKYEYRGNKRTVIHCPTEKRFSIYDSLSKKELLRVRLGEDPIYEVENVTEEDLIIFEKAIEKLEKVHEENLRRKNKDKDFEIG